MECYRHPGTAATTTCVACSQPICPECREDVAGHPMCHSCVAAASARLGDAPPAIPETESDQPSAAPWLASASAASGVYSEPASQPEHVPPAPGRVFGSAPGVARRIARGMVWGLVYAQWWTLWSTLSLFLWGQGSFDDRLIMFVLDRAIINAIFGLLAGIIIGAVNASASVGTNIGIGAGILVAILRMALSGNPLMLVNLFFYYVTGRFVGAGITWRVHQPVRGKPGAYGG